MANKKIKSESYGTQRQTWAGGAGAGSNFQHGKDLGTHTRGSLGTRGADSNWSRASQAVMPLNAFTHFLDEDEDEEFDEGYTVEDSKYDLQEILRLNEDLSDVGAAAVDIATDLGGDFAASAISGLDVTRTVGTGTSLLFITKNIYEIKKGRERADEVIRQFLNRPTNEAAEKMADIFDSLITDVIDLFQRTIEIIPDSLPIEEFGSIAISIAQNYKRAAKFLKAYFTFRKVDSITAVGKKFTAKSVRRVSFYGIVSPIIKMVMKLFNSDFVPEKVEENKSIIMGTISRIVLLGDLMEDYHIQKEVAIGIGIPEEDFVYRHRILQPGSEADGYDYESPRNELPFEDRVEEEIEIRREEMEQRQPEYSEGLFGPDADDDLSEPVVVGGAAAGAASQNSTLGNEFLRKLFISKPGDEGLFRESLENKSLLYLIEEKDSELDEELEEDEINEFSGAGGGAIGTLPLGMSTKGPKGKTSATSGGTAFPYSKKSRTAFKKYAKKSFGGK